MYLCPFQDSDDKSDSSSTKDKTTKQKATNLILKFFKSSNAIMHSQSDPIIKTTKDTKTYRKPSKTEELQTIIKPIISNESIDEGKNIFRVKFRYSEKATKTCPMDLTLL